MALTSAQKADVVFYLGWSGKTIIAGSTDYNSQVNSALDNLSAQIEAQVIATLAQIVDINTKLTAATCRLAAKRVDEIELNPNELIMLRSERRRLLRLLSRLLDIKLLDVGGGVNMSVCI